MGIQKSAQGANISFQEILNQLGNVDYTDRFEQGVQGARMGVNQLIDKAQNIDYSELDDRAITGLGGMLDQIAGDEEGPAGDPLDRMVNNLADKLQGYGEGESASQGGADATSRVGEMIGSIGEIFSTGEEKEAFVRGLRKSAQQRQDFGLLTPRGNRRAPVSPQGHREGHPVAGRGGV